MLSTIVTGKPPLPNKATETQDANNQPNSSSENPLKTSQQETISDGTILGLKDVTYINEPDLTYYCSLCQRFIKLLSLKDHKAYHTSLELLGFDVKQVPKSVDSLLQRRNQCIKDLKDSLTANYGSVDIGELQRIDDAYERLKQDLEDTYESCRKIHEDIDFNVKGFDSDCSLDLVSAVSYCSNQNIRWKSTMEDSKVYQDYFGNDKNKAFFAIFDGYNGKYAAAVAANELHYLLLNEMTKFDPKIDCKCTYNMLEENNISQYDLIRPPSPASGHTTLLHKQSANMIHQVIYTCEQPESDQVHLSSHHPIKMLADNSTITGVYNGPSARIRSAYADGMGKAFCQAYKLTDQVLAYGGDEKSRVRWSGCSALTMVLENVEQNSQEEYKSEDPDKLDPIGNANAKDDDVNERKGKLYEPPRMIGRLHIANAGNCHAVLIRDNRSYVVTKEHSYNNIKERHRVESAGGSFSQSGKEMRLNGVSMTTRGLGNHGDPQLKQLVTWQPYSHSVAIDQYCQMLVLASPGVWQVFTPQEAAEMLLQILPQNRIPSPGYISPSIEMLNTALFNAEQEQQVHSERIQPANDEAGLVTAASVQSAEIKREGSAVVTFKPTTAELEDKKQILKYTTEQADVDDADDEDDVLLPADLRSLDSGNEADVDTDWASTVPAIDFSRQSVTSKVNTHRQLARWLAERLVQSALLAGAKDNITAIIILLPGIKLME